MRHFFQYEMTKDDLSGELAPLLLDKTACEVVSWLVKILVSQEIETPGQ